MKLFFYDLETTGTDEKQNAIHQLSGKIFIDGKIRESFDFHIRPFEGAKIDGKALDVGHVTEEQIMAYPSGEEVYKKLCLMLAKYVNPFDSNLDQKFVTVGYNNAGFDDKFLYEFFARYHEISPDPTTYRQGFFKSNFFNKFLTLDVYHLAMLLLSPLHLGLENYKLGTVATKLGCLSIHEGELHRADFDIDTTINMFKKLMKRIDFKSDIL